MTDATAFYDDVWEKYAHLDAVSPAAFHRRRLVVERAFEARPNARAILDVGCGQGELLLDLRARFTTAKLAAADVSERSIEATRARLRDVDAFLIDLESARFEEEHKARLGTFDVVVCSEVLEHIRGDRDAAKRLFSLVAPGGVVVVTVPGGAMSRFDVAIGHVRHYSASMLRDLVESAGFRVDDVAAWGFPFHSLYRSAVRVASRFAVGDDKKKASAPAASKRGFSSVLGKAYGAFGKLLKPAFYLNVDRWGEQMIAVGTKLDRR